MNLKIIEEYDGRLPVFKVIDVDPNDEKKFTILKSFDDYNDANNYALNLLGEPPCGEEGP
ncbi:hypothetical protein EBR43_04650 [bacterium]|nr:hypothetical protein [bacterium]